MGIVYGDIGTSPLYTFRAIIGERAVSETLVLGALSCIIWTLTLQTTVKYVIITMRADNNGEGGILALYALIRRYGKKWLLYPAIAGASFLLADGIITPPLPSGWGTAGSCPPCGRWAATSPSGWAVRHRAGRRFR